MIFAADDDEEPAGLDERFSHLADAEVDLVGGDWLQFALKTFNKFPDADDRLASMADELTSLLKMALDLWALVEEAGPDDDPGRYHQPSIVPHAQNQRFHRWTTLIDLLWRAWTHIDARDRIPSRRLVDRWRGINYPTFRRMALAAMDRSWSWTVNEKLEALLNGL